MQRERSPFNLACRLAERYLVNNGHWKGLIPQLKEIHLFTMNGNPMDFLPKGYTEDQRDFHTDHFFLPFYDVAVEDDLGLVLLTDKEDNQAGLFSDRFFVMLAPLGSTGYCVVSGMSHAEISLNGFQFGTSVTLYSGTLIDEASGLTQDVDGRELMQNSEFFLQCAQNVGTAYQEMMLVNTPSRFVVEVAPIKLPTKTKKIARKEERPTYTLLQPSEIRKILIPQEPLAIEEAGEKEKRSTPAPHARRRHFRTLHDDCFTNKRGKIIEVKATWVGPEERIVGGKKYRVMLDL